MLNPLFFVHVRSIYPGRQSPNGDKSPLPRTVHFAPRPLARLARQGSAKKWRLPKRGLRAMMNEPGESLSQGAGRSALLIGVLLLASGCASSQAEIDKLKNDAAIHADMA